jgi:hypothetical protein
VLIYRFGLYGIAVGQIAGHCAGFFVAQHLVRPCLGRGVNWGSVRMLAVPLLLASCVAGGGQLVFWRTWIVPLYLLLAAAVFVLTVRSQLNQSDWNQLIAATPDPFRRILVWSRTGVSSPTGR